MKALIKLATTGAHTPSPGGGGSGRGGEAGMGGIIAPDKKKLFHPVPPHLLANARKLRQQLTDAEQLLWFCLRRKQLGVHFRRQHPIQQYVLDYYCLKAKLVVELDGGQHNEEQAIHHDSERTAFLERRGIKVIRVWNHEVFKNLEGVLELIYHTLQERVEGWAPAFPPLPSPPPPGEGT